ncbi:MAG: T9SS type A sorting domain-containing protein [bacterium]|nr:T9SS type A sorting domain-containing protein [bacterium]
MRKILIGIIFLSLAYNTFARDANFVLETKEELETDYTSMFIAMATGDVDEDGINEIVTVGAGKWDNITIWEVRDGQLTPKAPFNSQSYTYNRPLGGTYTTSFQGCFIGDADNDGENEILAAGFYFLTDAPINRQPLLVILKWNGSGFTSYDHTWSPGTGTFGTTAAGGGAIFSPYVEDVDNDGKKEILLTDNPTAPGCIAEYSELKILNWDRTRTDGDGNPKPFEVEDSVLWNNSMTKSGVAWFITCCDVDNDGVKEIITSGTTGAEKDVGHDIKITGYNGDVRVMSWHNNTFTLEAEAIWLRNGDHHSDLIAADDIDGDGKVEILAGASWWPNSSVDWCTDDSQWEYNTGQYDYELKIWNIVSGPITYSPPGEESVVYDQRFEEKYSDIKTDEYGGPTYFNLCDIDRDNYKEVIMGDNRVSYNSSRLRVKRLEFVPSTGYTLQEEYFADETQIPQDGPVVGIQICDVDNDGVDEMVVAQGYRGGSNNQHFINRLFLFKEEDEATLPSNFAGATAYNNQKQLALDGTGNLHTVIRWWNNKILYAMSDDKGSTWKNKYVINQKGVGSSPAIAMDNDGGINVCWIGPAESGLSLTGQSLYYSRKVGNTWGDIHEIYTLADMASSVYFSAPSMAVEKVTGSDNDIIHIAMGEAYSDWAGDYESHVYHFSFSVSSPSLASPDPIYSYIGSSFTETPIPSIDVFNDVSGNDIHLCWEADGDIYYKHSLNSGTTWIPSTPTLLSDGTNVCHNPSISAYEKRHIKVVYEKNYSGALRQIVEKIKHSSGEDWGGAIYWTLSPSDCYSPQIDGSIIAWTEGNEIGSNSTVGYLSNTPGTSSMHPQIVVKHGCPTSIFCGWTEEIGSVQIPYEVKHSYNVLNQYELSGVLTYGTTTIPQNSTLMINGNVTIDPCAVLIVEPGTKVYCYNSVSEQGKLTVKGTFVANSATFISDSSRDSSWGGIVVDTGGSVELRGCTIQDAKYGIYANGGSVVATNNLITNCSTAVYVASNAQLVDFGNIRMPNTNTTDDGMNSFLNNISWNFVNITNDSVFAQANYWGTFDTTLLKISGKVIYIPFGYDYQGADWTIANDTTIYGTFWNVGTFKINSGKTAKVASKSINTTGWIAIEADSFDIQGTFSADSAGWIAGEGPGTGTTGASAYGAGGAGYGGRGGAGGCNLEGDTSKYGGFAYGNLENPCDMGSGGGNADATYKGGAGGGIIRLISSGTINVAGTIKSDGKPGATNSGLKSAGGGSGGSVWLQTNKLTGNGLISAKGGNGSNGSSADGGAGAGGRLNVWYQQSSFTGRVDVSGGLAYDNAQTGQMGTALIHQTDDSVKIILSPVQTLSSTDSRYGFTKGIEFTNKYIRLTSGDSIVGNFRARAKDSIIVNTSSYIIADEKGYCHNQGTGYGHYGSSSHGAGGAGYGNIGGYGTYHTQGGTGDGGIMYGDSLMADSLGSGGGDWANTGGYRYGGGNGGGLIELECDSGTIVLNGTVSVNGSDGTEKSGYAGGGASGGSVLLFAKYLKGVGIINAKGGDGGSISNCNAGGGAGGRVMFYRDSTEFAGTVSVIGGDAGGTGATAGGIGTFKQDILPQSFTPVSYVNNAGLPFVFKMFQNYPNPFRNKTTIKYQIPLTSKVSLMLYDLTGRCVKTLVNEEQVPGYYKAELNSKDYPTGIYFAKFKAGEYKETKKLILMK